MRYTDEEGIEQLHGCYNKWCAPSYFGTKVVRFIHTRMGKQNLKKMKANVKNVQWVTEREYDCDRSKIDGIKMLEAILQGTSKLPDYIEYIKCSLWCEQAYVLNLDKNVIEFWDGFQPVYGNFWSYIDDPIDVFYEDGGKYIYGPCKLMGEKPFNDTVGWIKSYYHYNDEQINAYVKKPLIKYT